MKKPGKHHLTPVMKVNLTHDVMEASWAPWQQYIKKGKTHDLSITMKKILEKSKLSKVLQNAWPVLPKTVRVMKNEKNPRKCHSQESSKETWQLNVI